MRPIIKVENLSKQYRIGARRRARYGTLRESISEAVSTPLKRLRRNGNSAAEDSIWALKDVSFDVMPGEVLGIIGRNGAGKSTLLKVLSRITEPTAGAVDLYGRVSSLLEVGTGFHPELTGRENIYLNGAILGMRKAEIDRSFDEIVAFAEVEKFIDTPVKRYSSGMYMRLAFGIAAHLEPDILLVDEVLAVGDAAFQKKCLGKMKDIGRHGRTVLFVSHNMHAVTRICPRTILLDEGKIIDDGSSHEVVTTYLQSGRGTSARCEWDDLSKAPGNEIVRLRSVSVCTENGGSAEAVDIRHPVGIKMVYEVLQDGSVLIPNYHFFNDEGVYAFILHDFSPEWRHRPRPAGLYESTAWIPGNFLSEGTLIVGVAISSYKPFTIHFYERDAISFHVVDSMDGDSARGDYAGPIPGVIRPVVNWTTQIQS